MIVEAVAAALICLDPGHGTPPAVGRQTEPIGPGSRVHKIKDGGGASGEAAVALAIAKEDASAPPAPRLPGRDDADRPRLPLRHRRQRRARAVLQPAPRRAHAPDPRRRLDGQLASRPGDAVPRRYHRGWTDDIYTRSLRAARLVQRATVAATGAANNGLARRSDLTGFNWANVPAILVETGFMTNPSERRRLQSSSYQWRIARGFTAGVAAFTPPR